MQRTVPDIGHRKEQVIRQFMLDSGIPCLGVGNLTWVATELAQNASGIQEAPICELAGGRLGNGPVIPQTIAGDVRAERIDVENATEQASIVYGDLVVAVFIRTAVKEVEGKAAENHGLGIQLVGKSQAGAEILPMRIGVGVSGTDRAGTQFVGST